MCCVRYIHKMTSSSTSRTLLQCLWCSQYRCIVAAGLVLSLLLLLVLAQHLDTDVYSKLGLAPLQSVNLTRQVLPQCIIAGVRKCGTRALLEFLRAHSHLQLAHQETHFFDLDENYRLGLEWYRHQMPASQPHQLTIEKTPGYFINAKSPMRIRHMNSSIRLLFIVRDPVTRMISDYVQIKNLRQERNLTELAPFDELALEARTGRVERTYKPVRISLYHIHLSRWLSYFNWTQIHIVDGDALIRDPVPVLSKVEDFLGIEHQLTEDTFYYNTTRGFYCPRLPGQGVRCLGESKGRPHPTIKQKTLDTLCSYFKPHNQAFFNMTGQHFDWCGESQSLNN